jgi:adenylosuccinate lyase
MRANLGRQNGLLMSEPVMMALGATFGRQEAHEMVYEVCMAAFATGGSLKDGLLAHPTIAKHLTAEQIDAMLDPDGYTGDAAAMTDRVVAAARARLQANAPVTQARSTDEAAMR